jgi:Domain of unknown function (DUF4350)
MKQRLIILIGVVLLFVVLAGLNAATYTQKEKTPDSEAAPNRSTYNSGATGTQAFYTLLAETGRRVTRWQEPPGALRSARARPKVFVVVGPVRRGFEDAEIGHLLRWVSEGGRLIVIDRVPPDMLLTTTANWKLSVTDLPGLDLYSTDPTDGAQMTKGTAAIKPVQPTIFTNSVNAVQPSRFATSIRFALLEHEETTSEPPAQYPETTPTPYAFGLGIPTETPLDDTSEPPDVYTETSEPSGWRAPVVHLAAGQKNLVVDVAYGSGRIVYLADPYIVSNGGIGLVDNAQLGINLVAMKDAVVAFDEFHQGYGSNNNRLLQFFEGTPVVGIFLQIILLVGLVFFSQSRRFARAVPEPEPDRLSKLEYVAAMAELQNRTRAWDLAIENIYTEFRRRAVRAVGMDNTATTKDLAGRIAERTQLDAASVEKTLVSCEEIIRGEPTNRPEVLRLTGELRVIEAKLGMTRSRKATK